MSDHYVLLLEKVLEENKALREQMKQMADNKKTVLGELHQKIDNLKSVNLSRRVRQTGPSLLVPKMCRVCLCLHNIYIYLHCLRLLVCIIKAEIYDTFNFMHPFK